VRHFYQCFCELSPLCLGFVLPSFPTLPFNCGHGLAALKVMLNSVPSRHYSFLPPLFFFESPAAGYILLFSFLLPQLTEAFVHHLAS